MKQWYINSPWRKGISILHEARVSWSRLYLHSMKQGYHEAGYIYIPWSNGISIVHEARVYWDCINNLSTRFLKKGISTLYEVMVYWHCINNLLTRFSKRSISTVHEERLYRHSMKQGYIYSPWRKVILTLY
jgi:hypothetical protein